MSENIYKLVFKGILGNISYECGGCHLPICLSASCPVVHMASTLIFHCFLLLACPLATLQVFHTPLHHLYFSTDLFHVLFGLPAFILPSGRYVMAIMQRWFLSQYVTNLLLSPLFDYLAYPVILGQLLELIYWIYIWPEYPHNSF